MVMPTPARDFEGESGAMATVAQATSVQCRAENGSRGSSGRKRSIISGVFYIGLGDEFDADKLEAYPPGAVIVLPGNTSHFHWAKSGEYVAQVTAAGP
jgi:hypothetical protein